MASSPCNMALLQSLEKFNFFFFPILAPPLSFLLYPHSNTHDIISCLPHIHPLLISLHLPSQSFENPQSIKSVIDQEVTYDILQGSKCLRDWAPEFQEDFCMSFVIREGKRFLSWPYSHVLRSFAMSPSFLSLPKKSSFNLDMHLMQSKGGAIPLDYRKQEKILTDHRSRRLSHPGKCPLVHPHWPVSKILLSALVFLILECLGNSLVS